MEFSRRARTPSSRLEDEETRKPLDMVATLVLDLVEKLALAIARAQAELRQAEWATARAHDCLHPERARLCGASYAGLQRRRQGRHCRRFHTRSRLAVYNIEVKHWSVNRVGKNEVDRLLDVSGS